MQSVGADIIRPQQGHAEHKQHTAVMKESP